MSTDSTQQLLQRFPLFKHLSDEEMIPVLDIARKRLYREGTHLFMQGDPLTNVYFILNGKIKIYRTDLQGKEQIVNVLVENQMFPHQGFFRNDDYPAHAEVIEEGTLVHIPIHLFEQFLIANPQVSVKVFRVLGDIIVDLQNRLQEQILNNTYEQIILLLIRLTKSHASELEDDYFEITTQFTNRDLANMIGSSRETVSRTLTQLKKNSLIETKKNGNMVVNRSKLEEELF